MDKIPQHLSQEQSTKSSSVLLGTSFKPIVSRNRLFLRDCTSSRNPGAMYQQQNVLKHLNGKASLSAQNTSCFLSGNQSPSSLTAPTTVLPCLVSNIFIRISFASKSEFQYTVEITALCKCRRIKS